MAHTNQIDIQELMRKPGDYPNLGGPSKMDDPPKKKRGPKPGFKRKPIVDHIDDLPPGRITAINPDRQAVTVFKEEYQALLEKRDVIDAKMDYLEDLYQRIYGESSSLK